MTEKMKLTEQSPLAEWADYLITVVPRHNEFDIATYLEGTRVTDIQFKWTLYRFLREEGIADNSVAEMVQLTPDGRDAKTIGSFTEFIRRRDTKIKEEFKTFKKNQTGVNIALMIGTGLGAIATCFSAYYSCMAYKDSHELFDRQTNDSAYISDCKHPTLPEPVTPIDAKQDTPKSINIPNTKK